MKHSLLRSLLLVLVLLSVALTTVGCTVTVGPRPDVTDNGTIGDNGNNEFPYYEDRNPYADLPAGQYKIGDPTLVYRWSKDNDPIVAEKMENLNTLLAEGTDEEAFLAAYKEMDGIFDEIMTQYQLAYIEYCMLGDSEEAEENYLYINELYQDTLQELIVMYQTIYDSPFCAAFYEGWSEEDIQSALDQAAMYTDAFAEMQKLDDQFLVEYRALDIYDEQAAIRDLDHEFDQNNNDLAQALGYDNYMDYAYEAVYGRDYTVEEADTIVAYNRDYLIPLIKGTWNAFVTDANADWDSYERFLSITETDFTSYDARYWLKGYLGALDSEALGMYNDLLTQGNYFLSRNEESHDGAFSWYLYAEDKPLMYFGPGYAGITTFVHEFGHYMSFIHSEADCMDISETQSQADEMLFCRYMETLFGESVARITAEYQLFDSLFGIAQQLIINDFETYVYTHLDTLTADDLDTVYRNSIMKIFGDEKLTADEGEPMTGYDLFAYFYDGQPEIYWYAVTVESPGYYISYATSMMMALEIFAMSADDFDAAADVYMSLVHLDDTTFCEAMRACGLYDPLDEEAYKLISSVIRDSYLTEEE